MSTNQRIKSQKKKSLKRKSLKNKRRKNKIKSNTNCCKDRMFHLRKFHKHHSPSIMNKKTKERN